MPTTRYTPVPAEHRPWDLPCPAYDPVDITPPELRAPALAAPAPWITDPVPTPQQVSDWGCRQARALVHFEVRREVPLNPTGRTGKRGRNLGAWGENAAADPVVVAGTGAERRVLLILRGDAGQWALPGGMLDPGESPRAALARELREETGVDLRGLTPKTLLRTYVDDPRNSDHAWVSTEVGLYRLPGTVPAAAADDAVDARWWPLHTLQALTAAVEPAGGLYAAHRPLLAIALEHLGGQP
ncbi:NUDIX domain-containing protein [Nocardiopsis sp. NPDC006198]|uniref:NUDIX domain-containing protein n=1 Tax=Nocardiopsis sp. NPDC006198 TaxID=3154472 RepID=UPI0033B4A73E